MFGMNTLQVSVVRVGRLTLVFGIACLLGGCFVPLKYDVSVLQEIPQGFEGEIHKDVAELNFSEFTFLVQVQSFDWDGARIPGPLGVWMQFTPGEVPLELDTRSVTLRADDSDAIPAMSYLGPATPWWSPRAFAGGCGPRIYRTGIAISNSGLSTRSIHTAGGMQGVRNPSSRIIPINDRVCFMFWFDTEPRPEHVFVLSIDGVTVSGTAVPVPELRFEMATVSTLRGFP